MKPIPTVRLLCEIFMSTNGSPLKSPGAVGTRFIGPIGTLTSEYYDRLKTAKEKKYSKYILAEKKAKSSLEVCLYMRCRYSVVLLYVFL